MTALDVRELKKETLSKGQFPVRPQSDFRFQMTPEVHRRIQDHAKADVKVEICGVLVGRWEQDADGPFAIVTECIRCDSATSKFAEVTFTHESWSQINQQMDSRFSDQRIIGWYHSHPDFGIFLSDRDVFIHENFFSGAGQVAYVVDPVRDLEGIFVWRNGKPEPMEHYWIGEKVRTVEATKRSTMPALGSPANGGSNPSALPSPRAEDQSVLPMVATLLTWVAVFLLGYLLADLRSRWERNMIMEGAVAHYGLNKLMKVGFEENVAGVRKLLSSIRAEFVNLPKPTAELSEEEQAAADKSRRLIADNLGHCEQVLGKMQEVYGYSEVERNALAQLIAQKQAELQGTLPKKTGDLEITSKTLPAQKTPAKSPDKKPPAKPPSEPKAPDTNAPAPATETPATAETPESRAEPMKP